jgi:predicted O-methyltransferase YrrM
MNLLRKLITRIVVATQLPRNPFDGEMLPLERLTLYRWMLEHKPTTVFEVGTGVGGSTFYICEALRLHGGTLHTCDPIRRPPESFLNRFQSTLCYHAQRSTDLIHDLIRAKTIPDFLFFDGPEIPELAVTDLQLLEPHLRPGTLFAMHDWEQVGGPNERIVSIKAAAVRPYLEESHQWSPRCVLSGHQKNVWWTKGKYDSVGLCLYQYNPSDTRQLAA